jgi:ATP-dependent helicase/DNAse subunit B
MDYTNSILSLSSFYDCPHTHFKLAMMNVEQAKKLANEHEDLDHMHKVMKESEQILANFFNSVSAEQIQEMEHRIEAKQVFHYPLDTKMQSKAQSHVVTRRDFTIAEGQHR